MTTERQLYRYNPPGDPQCWIHEKFTEDGIEYYTLNSGYGIPVTVKKEEFERDYELVKVDGWRDISEAPMDGTQILITDSFNCSVVFWNNYWVIGLPSGYGDSDNEFYYPTHFMPLPPAPKATSG